MRIKITIGAGTYRVFIFLLIFLLSLQIRLINIELPYLTFDEHAYVGQGLRMVLDIVNPNLNFNVWDTSQIFNYDAPPLARYFYGMIIFLTQIKNDFIAIQYARIGSAILGSLTVYLVYEITKFMIAEREAIMASLILATMPLFIAHNKIAALETPLAFMFTITMYVFIKKRYQKFGILIAVILSALTLSVKYFGAAAFMIIGLYTAVFERKQAKIDKKSLKRLILFSVIYGPVVLMVFIAIWPYLWNHTIPRMNTALSFYADPNSGGILSPSGMINSFILNLKYTIVTTPLLVLVLLGFGLYDTFVSKQREKKLILIWFLMPYVILILAGASRHMRYFFPALVPMAIISSIGLTRVLKHTNRKSLVTSIFILYLFGTIIYIHPWYLDYYNELVGGPGNVYNKELYEIGYWGEGLGQAMEYIKNNVPEGAVVQFYVEPNPRIYPLQKRIIYRLPTDVPYGEYVIINTDCVWKNCVSGWLFINLGKEPPTERYSITYEKIEQAGYVKVFESSARGAVLSRVYRKI